MSECLRQRYPRVLIERVYNGEELLDAVNQGLTPQVIILDLNLPRKDGRETLQEIKENHPRIKSVPVFVFTTSNYDRDREFVIRQGAVFFSKPYEIGGYESFLDLIREYVDDRR